MISNHDELMIVFDDTTSHPANNGVDAEVLRDIGYVDPEGFKVIEEVGGLALDRAIDAIAGDKKPASRHSRVKGDIDFNALRAKLGVPRSADLTNRGLSASDQATFVSLRFSSNAVARATQSRERQ